jgi:hypothetical protein
VKSHEQGSALTPAGVLKLLSQNQSPIRFVSPTAALLPGLEYWIGGFDQICLTDSFDGQGRTSLVASGLTTQDFQAPRDAIAALMDNDDLSSQLDGADVVFTSLAEESLTEAEAFAVLRECKAVTTLKQIGASATYADFRKQCRTAGISFTVEAQLSSAPAGGRPWIVASEADWDTFNPQFANQTLICSQPTQFREFVIEAVATRGGTVLSPLQKICREHYWGVQYWTGTSCDESLSGDLQKTFTQIATRIGNSLATRGFRGAFSVEFESDPATGKTFVSRLVPGLSVNSILPHLLTTLHGGFPLHLLHVVSKLGVDPEIDVAPLRSRYDTFDAWTILAVRHTGPAAEMITRAPRTGLYRMTETGTVTLVDTTADHRSALGTETAYFMRLQSAGNYRASGTLLGLLYLRQAGLDELHLPTVQSRKWTDAFAASYTGLSVSGSSMPAGITTPPFVDII